MTKHSAVISGAEGQERIPRQNDAFLSEKAWSGDVADAPRNGTYVLFW